MAAQRIRAATANGLPRCKSEGTLIDLTEGFSETSFSEVKGELGQSAADGPGRGRTPPGAGPCAGPAGGTCERELARAGVAGSC
ncbi:SH3 domain-binding protein 4 [Galemys pyrenaicus]|uniref:SH3 domain-binding protein 4 n=1 Tax=Galemys pyrenaicus TaxID=202257 RepID=A0A8J6AE65_GALPY|nr:SH3 domain-binding protein 4 [Galemys pyrenaicus]